MEKVILMRSLSYYRAGKYLISLWTYAIAVQILLNLYIAFALWE